MSVKLLKRHDDTICINDMKDGQLAEIVEWGSHSGYIGRVIQRYMNILVTVGCCNRHAFKYILDERDEGCRVRLLKLGEMIEVVENEGAN